jgi:hypothetical protein
VPNLTLRIEMAKYRWLNGDMTGVPGDKDSEE